MVFPMIQMAENDRSVRRALPVYDNGNTVKNVQFAPRADCIFSCNRHLLDTGCLQMTLRELHDKSAKCFGIGAKCIVKGGAIAPRIMCFSCKGPKGSKIRYEGHLDSAVLTESSWRWPILELFQL